MEVEIMKYHVPDCLTGICHHCGKQAKAGDLCGNYKDIEVATLCLAVAEMEKNCDHDLCGDHRNNYNSRILVAKKALINLYPFEMATALKKARLF